MDTTTGNGSWSEVTQTATGTENKIKCEGLKPLHKYRFRVRAANKIGISDPGEMKGPDILMKDPWGKCRKDALPKQTFKNFSKGQNFVSR